MELVWNPWALFGLAVTAALVALAVLVFRARPGRLQNVALAAVLLCAALHEFFSAGLRFLLPVAMDAYAARHTAVTTMPLITASLLAFYSTLPVPLSKPLRPRASRYAMLAIAVALALFGVLRPELLVLPEGRWFATAAAWGFSQTGPLFLVSALTLAITLIFGIAVTRDAARRTAMTAERESYAIMARGFAVSFSLLIVFILLFIITPRVTPVNPWTIIPPLLYTPMIFHTTSVISLILVSWLAYGILKHQLFDIDLKIKRTLNRGALLAFFLLAFIVVAQVTQNYLNAAYGWVYGGIAAGLLLFALGPLERAARRIADAAMPGVVASPDYLAYRRLRVYEAALSEILADGIVTEKERRALEALRQHLGLPQQEARALEKDLAAKRAAT